VADLSLADYQELELALELGFFPNLLIASLFLCWSKTRKILNTVLQSLKLWFQHLQCIT